MAGHAGLRAVGFSSLYGGAFKFGEPIHIRLDGFAVGQPSIVPERLHIRAVSLRHRHFYRMDARLQGAVNFNWPSDLLIHGDIALAPDEVGIMACEGDCDQRRPVLYPSEMKVGPQTSIANELTLFLRADVPLAALDVVVRRDGTNELLFQKSFTESDQLSPQKPIRFAWPAALNSGKFILDAIATIEGNPAPDLFEAKVVFSP
jgi:hypothetical protein